MATQEADIDIDSTLQDLIAGIDIDKTLQDLIAKEADIDSTLQDLIAGIDKAPQDLIAKERAKVVALLGC